MFNIFGSIGKFFLILFGIVLSPFALLGLYMFIVVMGKYYYEVKIKKYPIIRVEPD